MNGDIVLDVLDELQLVYAALEEYELLLLTNDCKSSFDKGHILRVLNLEFERQLDRLS
jgi:hypothetical protein